MIAKTTRPILVNHPEEKNKSDNPMYKYFMAVAFPIYVTNKIIKDEISKQNAHIFEYLTVFNF